MQSAKKMRKSPEEKGINHKREFTILNHAIASFNTTAQELEQSYRLLHDQVRNLNLEIEEKNRQLEKNLNEKESVKNFLSNIMESLPTGVITTDLNGRLLMCNHAVKKITGVSPLRMNSPMLKEWLQKLLIPNGYQYDSVQKSTYDIEFVKGNSDIRNLKIFKSPVVGTNGQNIGILFIIQDQTRLKKLETQSERDTRLKAMGEMAIKIAHEVRNPLGSIELFASIMRRELNGQNDLRKMAERIITEVKSLDNSISNLLLFTRPQQPILNELNLCKFFEEFVDFIRPIVSKNGVGLEYKTNQSPFIITGDRDLLKQVFLNLTLNAMQAMPNGGTINIGLHSYRDEDESKKIWVEIIYRDNGIGIAPGLVNKIFHPFYTTKEKGTGLGLSIVHNIVESHNGILEVRSKLGKGTTFYISLPIAKLLK